MMNYKGNPDSDINQRIKQKLVNREVMACVSDMVEHLFDYEGEKMASWDEWDNLYIPVCPECGEHVWESEQDQLELSEDEAKLFGDNAWKCPYCGHVQEVEPDTEPQEIYEYWLVTEWLGEKLRKHGEPVFERWGGWIWGRCCTGQAIMLDYVISEIAYGMEILDGMANCKYWKE